jgi:hypothetical protein
MNQPVFNKQDRLDKVQAGLIQGAVIHAVYDGLGIGTSPVPVVARLSPHDIVRT